MQTAGSWCRCSRGRRRRQISLWRPLCIWWLVMIWRRHCSRSGRRSPPVWFLILRRLLLGQDWVGIRLRARSQGGVEWRAGRYGRILRVGARRRIELAVTWWHAEAGLTGERGRRSLKVLASLVGYAPIACRSLSRARAHIGAVLLAAPDCGVGLFKQSSRHLTIRACANNVDRALHDRLADGPALCVAPFTPVGAVQPHSQMALNGRV